MGNIIVSNLHESQSLYGCKKGHDFLLQVMGARLGSRVYGDDVSQKNIGLYWE